MDFFAFLLCLIVLGNVLEEPTTSPVNFSTYPGYELVDEYGTKFIQDSTALLSGDTATLPTEIPDLTQKYDDLGLKMKEDKLDAMGKLPFEVEDLTRKYDVFSVTTGQVGKLPFEVEDLTRKYDEFSVTTGQVGKLPLEVDDLTRKYDEFSVTEQVALNASGNQLAEHNETVDKDISKSSTDNIDFPTVNKMLHWVIYILLLVNLVLFILAMLIIFNKDFKLLTIKYKIKCKHGGSTTVIDTITV